MNLRLKRDTHTQIPKHARNNIVVLFKNTRNLLHISTTYSDHLQEGMYKEYSESYRSY